MLLRDIKESLLHLVYPHLCASCSSEALDQHQFLCIKCHAALPATDFQYYPNNPVEKVFWGRLPLKNATAQYYFTKESMMQRLMHQFKYKGNKDLGFYLGRLMGQALAETNRFSQVDALVPLPLFREKERKRGFNQAMILCMGIAEVLKRPVLNKVVVRASNTDSQTRKNRIERWTNMEGQFCLLNEAAIKGRHLLLVDDVVTTGATLEACGRELLKEGHSDLSIATLCYSGH